MSSTSSTRLICNEDQTARLSTWWYFAKPVSSLRPITRRADVMVRLRGARMAPTSSSCAFAQVRCRNMLEKGWSADIMASGRVSITEPL